MSNDHYFISIYFQSSGGNQDHQKVKDWNRSWLNQDSEGDPNYVFSSTSKHHSHLWRYSKFSMQTFKKWWIKVMYLKKAKKQSNQEKKENQLFVLTWFWQDLFQVQLGSKESLSSWIIMIFFLQFIILTHLKRQSKNQ